MRGSRRGKPQYCRTCMDSEGNRMPMKGGHANVCPTRGRPLPDVVASPFPSSRFGMNSHGSSSPPAFSTSSSPSTPNTAISFTTPPSSPSTGISFTTTPHVNATPPSNSYVDMSTMNLDDIFDYLATIPSPNTAGLQPAFSPVPYLPINFTNVPSPAPMIPEQGYVFHNTTPPSNSAFGLSPPPDIILGRNEAFMDHDDTANTPTHSDFDFAQFINIMTPGRELESITPGDIALARSLVSALQNGASPSLPSGPPSPSLGGLLGQSADSTSVDFQSMFSQCDTFATEPSTSTSPSRITPDQSNDAGADGPTDCAAQPIAGPVRPTAGSKVKGVHRLSSEGAVLARKAKMRAYAFLEETARRTNEHSRLGLQIMGQIFALEQKTAPFILVYISRPESVLNGQGNIFSHMSDNLREILGDSADAFLDDIHKQVVDFCHAAQGRQVQVAIDINLTVERKKRQQAEEKLVALEEEIARLRTEATVARSRSETSPLAGL